MRILDAATQETLVEVNQCVHASDEFAKAGEFPVGAPLPVATVDSAACPESLGISDTQFNALFADKVAVWLHNRPSDIACDKDFYAPQNWYKRMIDAGALGVVTIVPYIGRQAGIYSNRFDRKEIWDGSVLADLPQDQYIPFIFCANDGAKELGNPGSQSSITAFVESWYESVEDRDMPFTSPLVVDSLITSNNPWSEMFDSTLYFVAMRVAVPLMFFFVFFVAMLFSYERFAKAYKLGRTWKFALTPPLVAMLVEGLAVFFLAIFYAVDGQWSNADSSLKGLRLLFFGELLLVSVSTSVLVGLTFGDFRRSSKRLRNMNKDTFVHRHRFALIVTSASMLGLEVIAGIFRGIPVIYQLINAFAICVGGVISAWFFFEAKMFTEILKTLATSQNGTSIGGSSTMLRGMVRHIQKWSFTASCTLVVTLSVALAATFHPYFIWRASSWAAFWFCFHTLRAFFAFCKFQLSRLPRNERGSMATTTRNVTQENYPTGTPTNNMGSFKTVAGNPSYTPMTQSEHTSI